MVHKFLIDDRQARTVNAWNGFKSDPFYIFIIYAEKIKANLSHVYLPYASLHKQRLTC